MVSWVCCVCPPSKWWASIFLLVLWILGISVCICGTDCFAYSGWRCVFITIIIKFKVCFKVTLNEEQLYVWAAVKKKITIRKRNLNSPTHLYDVIHKHTRAHNRQTGKRQTMPTPGVSLFIMRIHFKKTREKKFTSQKTKCNKQSVVMMIFFSLPPVFVFFFFYLIYIKICLRKFI